MRTQRIMWSIWPAFLRACALELLVFALVDPQDLHWSGQPRGLSRQGVYSVAFFVFCLVCMGASGLTALLGMAPDEVNRCPYPRGERPDSCEKGPL